jgi:tetratricopeptide (TPR) repeat protein
MALSLPVFSDSFSGGMAPNVKRPLIERQQQRIEVVPNMFLSSKSPFTISVDTDSRFGGRAAGDDDEARKLGFDTRLHLLDSSEWNEGTAIDTSTIEDQVASSLFKKSSLAWLPWIPTLSQIQGLKLAELKQACAERGLKKSGLKAEVQERLWEWSQKQREVSRRARTPTAMDMGLGLNQVYSTKIPKPTFIKRRHEPSRDEEEDLSDDEPDEKKDVPSLKANSLAEWSRDGVDHLLSRRQAIHREKRQGKKKITPPPKPNKQEPTDYRSYLTKAFEKSSSTLSNNRQVKELYAAAKAADQAGDRQASKTLLHRLKEMTPNDGRILRRLARMEVEEGRVEEARAILQEGVRLLPDNAHLWHGLGQLEVSLHKQRQCYEKAIAADPSLPHPYHALGTMEHTQGRIAVAIKILKKGIQYCPTNHRLHHALGDIYREAKMLDMAEKSYQRALEFGPKVSHCFAYTAIAFLSYEKGEIENCRQWLRKSVSLNKGRHSQGWVALAQMEEAEGNIDGARAVCIGAISQYERGLLRKFGKLQFEGDPMAMKETLFRHTVPQYRSGDKFVNVFRNWARLEQKYGRPENVDDVYTRATIAFPYDWKLAVNWAQYHESVGNFDHAREHFAEGCKRAKNRHADPYRLFAEFEMSSGNYEEARNILFRGAKIMAGSSDGGLGNGNGLAALYHTWAVCEWHLGDLSRATVLFDDALRLLDSGEDTAKLRSFILYSMAQLHYFRGEYELAQHCIGLCLAENALPGDNYKIWRLWSDIASEMDNAGLAEACEKQAAKVRKEQRDGVFSLSSDLGQAKPNGLSTMVSASSQPLMRRDPWHDKIFGLKKGSSAEFSSNAKLPVHEKSNTRPLDDERIAMTPTFENSV